MANIGTMYTIYCNMSYAVVFIRSSYESTDVNGMLFNTHQAIWR